MKKLFLIYILGISLSLVGCSAQTYPQNTNLIEENQENTNLIEENQEMTTTINQNIEEEIDYRGLPVDTNLKVLEVREMFSSTIHSTIGIDSFKDYIVHVILKDENNERYNLYYSRNELTIYIDNKISNDLYLNLTKLVPGDYIKYDSLTNQILFSYQ